MAEENNIEVFNEQGGAKAPAKARPRKQPKKPPSKPLPPWKIFLHNDDVNEMHDVVKIVRQLTPLNKEEAWARVREANQSGVALLLVTHRERAELYVEQFTSTGLTVTAEPEA